MTDGAIRNLMSPKLNLRPLILYTHKHNKIVHNEISTNGGIQKLAPSDMIAPMSINTGINCIEN